MIYIPKKLIVLDILSLIFLASAVCLVFFYTPVETSMGLVQKVFYFHVAHAWIGMLSFLVAAITSVLFLIKGNFQYDFKSLSAVEIGLYFTIIGVISGSIWARPAWNTWWTWDPRLTTTSIMALIYIGYIFLRKSLDDPAKRSRIAAVYCILGFFSVPLTFFSIRGYRSIHPVVIGGGSKELSMTFSMFFTLLFSIITFTIIFCSLFWHRYLLEKLNEEVEKSKYYENSDTESD